MCFLWHNAASPSAGMLKMRLARQGVGRTRVMFASAARPISAHRLSVSSSWPGAQLPPSPPPAVLNSAITYTTDCRVTFGFCFACLLETFRFI